MTHFKIAAIGLFYALCFSFTVSAQPHYDRKESESPVEGGDHHIFATADHHYIVISYPYAEENAGAQIGGYDSGLKRLYFNQPPELAGKTYEEGISTGNGIIVFFADKEHNVQGYLMDGKTGHLSAPTATLFSFDEGRRRPEFFAGTSPDHKHQYCFVKYEKKKTDGTTFDGVITDDQMKMTTRFSFADPEKEYELINVVGLLANDGSLSIVYGASEKTNKADYVPYKFTLVQVSGEGKTSTKEVTGLPEGDLRGLCWKQMDNKLQFAGLVSLKKKADYTSLVTGTFDPQQKKTTDVKITALSKFPNLPDVSLHYVKEMVAKGIPLEAAPETPFDFSDGSRVLVYQENGGFMYSSHFPNQPDVAGAGQVSYSVPILTRGSVYLIKLNARNEPEWLNVAPKDQMEPDANLHIGLVSIADKKDGIHLFFYDDPKNESAEPAKTVKKVGAADHKRSALACVYVSADGKMSKTFLYNANDYEFHLSPERSSYFFNNELLFLSFKAKGISFSIMRLYNHAEYRLGTITAR